MRRLFDWLLDEGLWFQNIDLFSGEIWHTEFGFEVLEILTEYFDKGVVFGSITIPTNCSFILENDTLHRMQRVIDDFNARGVRLIISCSIEGKVLEDITRPFKASDKEEERQDAFYDKLFEFCKRNMFLFHPMVSATNVRYWINNLQWFEKQLKEYNFPHSRPVMMLEVRNDDWEYSSIRDLLKYYEYQIETHLESCGGDIKKFAMQLLGGDDAVSGGYINYALPLAENHPGCSASDTFSVRLGDLSIVPCHRTSYKQLIYGKFDVQDEKIMGITANNPQMAIRTLCSNQKISQHGCDICPYNTFCMRGCLGAQYEYSNEPFMPIPSVCTMFKAKYDFLIKTYEKLGVVDIWRNLPSYSPYYPITQAMIEGIEKIESVWGCEI